MRTFFLLLVFVVCRMFSVVGQTVAQDSAAIVFVNVNVWDGKRDSLLRNAQVVIVGNRIKQVGAGVTLPVGAKVVDCKGYTMIPGLSDAHVHLMPDLSGGKSSGSLPQGYATARAVKYAEHLLKQGFTTVRDMGGSVDGLKRAIDEGYVAGPRIYSSEAAICQAAGNGAVGNPEGYSKGASTDKMSGCMFVVNGRPEMLNAVRENLHRGAAQINLRAGGNADGVKSRLHAVQFTSDELKAGVEAASDWGTYVGMHAYHPENIVRALNAGVKTIEHGYWITDSAMMLIRDRGAWLVPQCNWVAKNPQLSSQPDRLKEIKDGVAREMELAKKYGVKVGFATDIEGVAEVDNSGLGEFAARTQWFSPIEVLRQATSGNGEIFALSGRLNPYPEGTLGMIQPGGYADLLIYDGNPLANMQLLAEYPTRLKLIMKDGKIYKSDL